MASELDLAKLVVRFYQQMFRILPIILGLFFTSCDKTDIKKLIVNLDYSETPHLEKWGEDAKQLLLDWIPKISNLLEDKNFPDEINLVFQKSEEGIAYADSNKIVVSSHWIEKYPDDIGLIVHEGVHVVQLYPSFHPGWLTEGIADYIRWHLYEKKQLDWFPLSKNEKGWEDAYQATGGFLLWLTIEKNPNIVKILHSAMKTESYSDSIFNENCGNDLPKLWMDYNDFRDEK